MFETGPNNAALVRAYAKSVSFPHASSYMTAGYAMTPNHTDYGELPHQCRRLRAPGCQEYPGARTGGALASSLFGRRTRPDQPHGNSVFLDVLHLFVLRWPAYTTWPMILLLWVAFAYSIRTLSKQERLWNPEMFRVTVGATCALFGLPPIWAGILLPFRGIHHGVSTAQSGLIIAVLRGSAFLVAFACIVYWIRKTSRNKVLLGVAFLDLVFLSAAAISPGMTSLFLLQAAAIVLCLTLVAVPFSGPVWQGPLVDIGMFTVAACVLVPALHVSLSLVGLQNAPIASLPCSLLIVHGFPAFTER